MSQAIGIVTKVEDGKFEVYIPESDRVLLVKNTKKLQVNKLDPVEFKIRNQSYKFKGKFGKFTEAKAKVLEERPLDYLVQPLADKTPKVSIPKKLFIAGSTQVGSEVLLYKTYEGKVFKVVPVDSESNYPQTVCKTKLPILSLQEEFKHNPIIQQSIQEMAKNYSSWRPCRGDGNCYFRAVGVSLVEHFAKSTCPIHQLNKFYNCLQAKKGVYSSIPNYTQREKFLELLAYIYKLKLHSPETAIQEIQNLFQDSALDQVLVSEMRTLAYNYLIHHYKSPEISYFMIGSIESVSGNILEFGKEAEGVVFYCMAKVLQVNITHIIMDRSSLSKTKFESDNPVADLHVLLRPGHYDILYPEEQANSGNSSFENLHKLSAYVSQYVGHMHYLYYNLYLLAQSNSLPFEKLDPNFRRVVSEFHNQFRDSKSASVNLEQSVTDSEEKFSQFLRSNVTAILQHCDYCLGEVGTVQLGCSHRFCQKDAFELLGKATNWLFVVDPSEAMDPACLICGVLMAQWDVKRILGDSYEHYYLQMKERTKTTYKCGLCEQNLEKESFSEDHFCLCTNCLKEILEENLLCPACFKFTYSENPQKSKCFICESTKYPESVVCQSHYCCENCDYKLYQTKLCVCGRELNQEELLLLNLKHKSQCEQCQSYENQLRDCGCQLCEECFQSSISQNGSVCFVCSKQLQEIDIAELQKLYLDVPPVKTCNICFQEYPMNSMITLDCEHYFCRDCLTTYFSGEIRSNKSEVFCPNACAIPVNPHIIQNLVSESDWDYFNSQNIKKNLRISECPQCKSVYEVDNIRVRCFNCRKKYCFKCLEYPHEGSCDKAAVKRVIESYEKEGKEFSQCPGCKTPYLKDEGCEHVTCADPTCKLEFCFQCACIRQPTLVHGNHYHRPECRFYSSYSGKDVFESKCSECTKQGAVCARPSRLNRPRKFSDF